MNRKFKVLTSLVLVVAQIFTCNAFSIMSKSMKNYSLVMNTTNDKEVEGSNYYDGESNEQIVSKDNLSEDNSSFNFGSNNFEQDEHIEETKIVEGDDDKNDKENENENFDSEQNIENTDAQESEHTTEEEKEGADYIVETTSHVDDKSLSEVDETTVEDSSYDYDTIASDSEASHIDDEDEDTTYDNDIENIDIATESEIDFSNLDIYDIATSSEMNEEMSELIASLSEANKNDLYGADKNEVHAEISQYAFIVWGDVGNSKDDTVKTDFMDKNYSANSIEDNGTENSFMKFAKAISHKLYIFGSAFENYSKYYDLAIDVIFGAYTWYTKVDGERNIYKNFIYNKTPKTHLNPSYESTRNNLEIQGYVIDDLNPKSNSQKARLVGGVKFNNSWESKDITNHYYYGLRREGRILALDKAELRATTTLQGMDITKLELKLPIQTSIKMDNAFYLLSVGAKVLKTLNFNFKVKAPEDNKRIRYGEDYDFLGWTTATHDSNVVNFNELQKEKLISFNPIGKLSDEDRFSNPDNVLIFPGESFPQRSVFKMGANHPLSLGPYYRDSYGVLSSGKGMDDLSGGHWDQNLFSEYHSPLMGAGLLLDHTNKDTWNQITVATLEKKNLNKINDIKFTAAFMVPVFVKKSRITYDLMGGSWKSKNYKPNTTFNYNTNLQLPSSEDVKRDKYEFKGWYTNKLCIGSPITTVKYGDNVTKVYAAWERKYSNIQYNLNGGSWKKGFEAVVEYSNRALTDKLYLPTKDNVTRKNYTLKCWKMLSGFKNGYPTENLTYLVKSISTDEADLVLEAQWEPDTYKVVFNYNGGTSTELNVKDDKYTVGMLKVISEFNLTSSVYSTSVEKEGYTFDGWYSDNKFKTKVSLISANSKSKDDVVNLYAKWTPSKYSIKYVLNGGTSTEGTVKNDVLMKEGLNVNNDIELLKAEKLSKTGYKFAGWYITDENKIITSVQKLTQSNNSTLTLNAKWVEYYYNLEYNFNGGKATGYEIVNDKYVENNLASDVVHDLISSKLMSNGSYEFDGWYLDNKKVDSISKGLASENQTIKVYAKWKAGIYDIVYDLGDKEILINGKKYLEQIFNQYNIDTTEDHILLSNENLKRKGYVLKGWMTEENNIITKVDKLTQDNKSVLNLTAVWEEVKFNVKYVLNGGEILGKTGPANEYIEKNIDSSIDYELYDGTQAKKTGYTFGGWYSSQDYSIDERVLYVKTGSVEDGETIVVYAHWGENIYSVEYVLNGGWTSNTSGSLQGDVYVESNISSSREHELINKKSIFKGSYYEFDGWYYDSEFLTSSIEKVEAGYIPHKNRLTVYAKWKPKTYTVNYHLDGGEITGKTESEGVYAEEKIDSTKDYTFYTSSSVKKPGYIFSGWVTNPENENTAINNIGEFRYNFYDGDTLDVYAVWLSGVYNVKYNFNGGIRIEDATPLPINTFTDGAYNVYKIDTKEDYVLLSDLGKAGYEFDGWYESSDFSTDKLTVLSAHSRKANETVELYAKWVKNEYTLIYNLNGGTLNNSVLSNLTKIDNNNYKLSHDGQNNIILISPRNITKSGYNFDGWYINDTYKSLISLNDFSDTDTLTVTARWTLVRTQANKITYVLPAGLSFKSGYVPPQPSGTSGNINLPNLKNIEGEYASIKRYYWSKSKANNPTQYYNYLESYKDKITEIVRDKNDTSIENSNPTCTRDYIDSSGTVLYLNALGTFGLMGDLRYETNGLILDKYINDRNFYSSSDVQNRVHLDYIHLYYYKYDMNTDLLDNKNINVDGYNRVGVDVEYVVGGDDIDLTKYKSVLPGYNIKGWFDSFYTPNQVYDGKKYRFKLNSYQMGTNSYGEERIVKEPAVYFTDKLPSNYTFPGLIPYIERKSNKVNLVVPEGTKLYNDVEISSDGQYIYKNEVSLPTELKTEEALPKPENIYIPGKKAIAWYPDTFDITQERNTSKEITYFNSNNANNEVTTYLLKTEDNLYVEYSVQLPEVTKSKYGSHIQIENKLDNPLDYSDKYYLTNTDSGYRTQRKIDLTTNAYDLIDANVLWKINPDVYNWKFLGWHMKEDLSDEPITSLSKDTDLILNKTKISGVEANVVKLYPEWVKSGFNVNYVLPLFSETIGDIDINGKKDDRVEVFKIKNGKIVDKSESDKVYNLIDLTDQFDSYEFLGWYDNQYFRGDKITSIPIGKYSDNEDVFFYGKLNVLSYDLKYHLDGKDIKDISIYDNIVDTNKNNPTDYVYTFRIPYDSDYTLLVDSELKGKDNLELYGWYNNKNLVGTRSEIIKKNTNNGISEVWSKYIIIKYDLKLNTNGGTFKGEWYKDSDGIAYEHSYNKNTHIATLSQVSNKKPFTLPEIEKVGYVFKGWYSNSSFAGEKLTELVYDTVKELYNFEVFAKWEERDDIKINYNLDGGEWKDSEPNNTRKYTEETTLPTKDDIQKDGYEFVGWLTDKNDPDSIITVIPSNSLDTDVYAKWEAKTYTITYETNGGAFDEGVVLTYDRKYNEEVSISEKIKKVGYIFDGWYLAKDFSSDKINKISENTKDVIVYAKWIERDDIKINYDLNGGEWKDNEPKNTRKYTDETKLPSKDDVKREGYDFGGWLTDKNDPSSVITEIPPNSLDTDVYANWIEIDNYKIIYNLNGGKWNSGEHRESTDTTGMSIVLRKYTEEVQLDSGIEKEGYTFDNWYDSDYKNVITKVASKTASDVSIYAKWIENEYSIVLNTNGGIYVNGYTPVSNKKYTAENVLLPIYGTEIDREGYMFAGWYDNPEFEGNVYTYMRANYVGEQTYYAKWVEKEKEKYSIVYDLSGGSFVDGYNPPYIRTADEITELPTKDDVVREAYEFVGWYNIEDVNRENVLASIDSDVESDIKLVAEWAAIDGYYSITYMLNGGDWIDDKEGRMSRSIAESYVLPTNVAKTGYSFAGWYEADDLSGDRIYVIKIGDGDKTVYAKWEEKTDYKIDYELNGGSWKYSDKSTTRSYHEAVILATADDLEREGYEFVGWVADAELYGNIVTKVDEYTSEDMIFYAKWNEKSYPVVFELGEDAEYVYGFVPKTSKLYSDANFLLPTADSVERERYQFGGWYDNQSFNGNVYTYAKPNIADTQTYYAKWIKIYEDVYTIDYELNGGKFVDFTPVYTRKYGDEIILPTSENVYREDFRFIGWYDNNKFEGEIITKIAADTETNVRLYAKFEREYYYITYHTFGMGVEGNNVDVYTDRVSINNDYTLLNIGDVIEGYKFDGWYENDSDGGMHNQVINPSDRPAKSKLTTIEKDNIKNITDVYARFELDNYKLTYFFNGGEKNGITVEDGRYQEVVKYGQEYILLTDIQKDNGNFQFEGWYTDDKFSGEKIATIDSSNSNNITELYAKWSRAKYIVNYHLNGAEKTGSVNGVYSVTVDAKRIYVLFDELSKEVTELVNGKNRDITYGLEGWYDNEELSGKKITEIRPEYIDIDTSVIDVYAKFVISKYPISLHLNGGKFNIIDTSVDIYEDKADASNIYVLSNDISRLGYEFDGWYANEELNGDKLEFIPIHNPDNIFDVYAKWLPNQYKVVYHLENGSITDSDILSQGTYNATNDTFTLDRYSYENYNLIQEDKLNRPGYKFISWNSNLDAEVEINYIEAGQEKNAVVDVYAKWERIDYKIITHMNYGKLINGASIPSSVQVGVTTTLPQKENVYREGFVFDGWYDSDDNIITEVVSDEPIEIHVYAKFTPMTYDIEYDLDDGNFVDETKVPYKYTHAEYQLLPTIDNIVKDGFDFVGWYDTADKSGYRIYGIKESETGNKKYYAKWEKVVAKNITYVLNGGQFKAGYEAPIYYDGEELILPTSENVVKDRSVFKGWYKYSTFAGDVQEKIEKGSTNKSFTYYAKWEDIIYNIEYKLNGASFINESNITKEYKYGDTIILPTEEDMIYENMSFIGWYIDSQFNSEKILNEITGNYEGLILYAKWVPIDSRQTWTLEYNIPKILYNDSDDEISVVGYDIKKQTLDVGDTIKLPSDERVYANGYHIIGFTKVTAKSDVSRIYYKHSEAEDYGFSEDREDLYPDDITIYTQGQNVNLNAKKGDNIILRPLWKENTYTIKFDFGERGVGEPLEDLTNVYYTDSVYLEKPENVYTSDDSYEMVAWEITKAVDKNGKDVMSEIRNKVYELDYSDRITFPHKNNAVITMSLKWKSVKQHKHLVCGQGTACTHKETGRDHQTIGEKVYTPITSAGEFVFNINDAIQNGLDSIYLYLDCNIAIPDNIEIDKNIKIYICLNGNSIELSKINTSSDIDAEFYVTNCQDNEVDFSSSATDVSFDNIGLHIVSGNGKINVLVKNQLILSENRNLELYDVDIKKYNSNSKIQKLISLSGNADFVNIVNVNIEDLIAEDLVELNVSSREAIYIEKLNINNIGTKDNKVNNILIFNPVEDQNVTVKSINIISNYINQNTIFIGENANLTMTGNNNISGNNVYDNIIENKGEFTLKESSSLDIVDNDLIKNNNEMISCIDQDSPNINIFGNLTITNNQLVLTNNDEGLYGSSNTELAVASCINLRNTDATINVGEGIITIVNNKSYDDSEKGYMNGIYAPTMDKAVFTQAVGVLDSDSRVEVTMNTEDGEGIIYNNSLNDDIISSAVFTLGGYGEDKEFNKIVSKGENVEATRKTYNIELYEGTPKSRSNKTFEVVGANGEQVVTDDSRIRIYNLKAGKDITFDGQVYSSKGFNLSNYKIASASELDLNDVVGEDIKPNSIVPYLTKEDGVTIKLVADWIEKKVESETSEITLTATEYKEVMMDLISSNVNKKVEEIENNKPKVVVDTYYTVRYHTNGGKILAIDAVDQDVVEEQNKTGVSYLLYDSVEKDGYLFVGWFDENDEKITVINEPKESDIYDVYAKWEKSTYRLTYHLEGASISGITETDTHIEEKNIGMAYKLYDNVEKDGYIFLGWVDENNNIIDVLPETMDEDIEVWPSFKSKLFTLNYHLNGGIVESVDVEDDIYQAEVNIENKYTLITNVSKEGYEFAGWYKDNNTFKSQITFIEASSKENITDVYAKFNKASYKVTYHFDGGRFENIDIEDDKYEVTVKYGQEYILNTNVVKEGFIFLGWYDSDMLLNPYSMPKYSIYKDNTADVDLYPKYNKDNYNVTYNLDGGIAVGYEAEDGKIIVNASKKYEYPLISEVEKEGHEFLGWAKSNGEIITSLPKNYNFDIELFAKYEDMRYDIIYHLDGGIVEGREIVDDTIYEKGDRRKVWKLISDVKKEGWAFYGWYSKEIGDFNKYELIGIGNTKTIDIWAVYTMVDDSEYFHDFRYHLDGGSIQGMTVKNDMVTVSIDIRNEYGLDHHVVKDGYQFVGWYEKDEFGNYKNVPITKVKLGEMVEDVYAKYEKVRYDLIYNLDGGIIAGKIISDDQFKTTYLTTQDTAINLIAEKDGYDFEGWYQRVGSAVTKVTSIPKGTTEDISLYAKFVKRVFNINYYLGAGEFASYEKTDKVNNVYKTSIDNRVDYILINDVVSDNLDFAGWYTSNDDHAEKITKIEKLTLTEDINVYAKYAHTKYKVIYHYLDDGIIVGKPKDANGDTCTVVYTNDVEQTLETELQRDGFEFEYWTTYDNVKIDKIPAGNTQDIHVYASWKSRVQLLFYHLNGGYFDEVYKSNSSIVYVLYDSYEPFKLRTDVVKGSYTLDRKTNEKVYTERFVGWYKDRNLTDGPITEIAVKNPDDITDLYAKYEKAVYSVMFETYGGDILENGVRNDNLKLAGGRARRNVEYKLPDDVYKDNYTFKGWYLDPEFTDGPYKSLTLDIDSDVYVYAQYELSRYELTYHLNGGSIAGVQSTDVLNVSVGLNEKYILSDISKEGYYFLGWFDNEDFVGDAIISIEAYNPNDIHDVYAKFGEYDDNSKEESEKIKNQSKDEQDEKSKSLENELMEMAKAIQEGYGYGGMSWLETLFYYIQLMNGGTRIITYGSPAIKPKNDGLFGIVPKAINNLFGDGDSEQGDIQLNVTDLYAHDTLTPELLGVEVADGFELTGFVITDIKDNFGNSLNNDMIINTIYPVGAEVTEIVDNYENYKLDMSAVLLDLSIKDMSFEDIITPVEEEDPDKEEPGNVDPRTVDPAKPDDNPYPSGGGSSGGSGGSGGGTIGGGSMSQKKDENSGLQDPYSSDTTVGKGIVNPYGFDGRGDDNGALKAIFSSNDLFAAISKLKFYKTIDLQTATNLQLNPLKAGLYEYYPAANNYKYFYIDKYGERNYIKNGWVKLNTNVGDKWFKFDRDGIMLKGFIKENDKIYYLRNTLDGVSYMMTGYVEWSNLGLIAYFNDDGELKFVFESKDRDIYLDPKLPKVPTNALNEALVNKLLDAERQTNVITKTVKANGSTSLGNFVGYWYYLKDGRVRFRLETVNNHLQMSTFAKNGWVYVYDKTGNDTTVKFDINGDLMMDQGYLMLDDGIVKSLTNNVTKLAITPTGFLGTLKGIDVEKVFEIKMDESYIRSDEVSEVGIVHPTSISTKIFTTTTLTNDLIPLNQSNQTK